MRDKFADQDVRTYNAAQDGAARTICDALAECIDAGLTGAESKVWHGAPVWFLAGNPIVGYGVRKIEARDLRRWLRKAKTIQWDYKNIVKRRGVLEKLGDW